MTPTQTWMETGVGPGRSVLSSGRLLLWGVLATVTMLFAGFASAYLVRQSGTDWAVIAAPRLLWINTLVLIASSFTLELARGQRNRGNRKAFRVWAVLTGLLGAEFLVGQLLVWRQLAAQGIYLPTNPHSSFFYILTGLHGLHLVGGLVFLGYALARAWGEEAPSVADTPLDLSATFWHFLDGLWLFLAVLLFAVIKA